jgi:hypothetical protein
VAAALDLAEHALAGHQTTELADRSLHAALVDLHLERAARDRSMVVDRRRRVERLAALVVVGELFVGLAGHE